MLSSLARQSVRVAVRSSSLGSSLLANSSRTGAAAKAAALPNASRLLSSTAISNADMFCRQCEQTQDHKACVTVGVCGKTPETASAQDALMQVIKQVCSLCTKNRSSIDPALLEEARIWTLAAAFSTLTNVNFSTERIAKYTLEGSALVEKLGGVPVVPTNSSIEDVESFGLTVSVPKRAEQMNHVDAFSLHEMATYGLKGVCAYAMHVHQLDPSFLTDDIKAEIQEIYAKLFETEPDFEGLLANVMKVGQTNAKVLQALDAAHAAVVGEPTPTQYRTTALEGKCILISGHDMMDLLELLKQTEGTGINVYTHGEMLPAHSYPKLKAFPHLVGNYGTAWQNQRIEFAGFPGPIIVTTNCIVEPRRVYRDRLFTMNEVGVDGVQHIENRDFSKVIESAMAEKGFPRTVEPAHYRTTGFNHRAVLPLAGKVLEAVSKGELSHIFLIGGCDGSQWDRSYFTDLAEETPDDSIILTLGCAKNRIIHSPKLENAVLPNGLPRVLDMGQCNDSYSAIVVATALADALKCSVNDLPLTLALSHLEQKAAAVLLTLVSMGVKNIHLGPSLPAYVSPNILNFLQQEYNLQATSDDAKADIQRMMKE